MKLTGGMLRMSDRLFRTLFYGLTSALYVAFLLLDACGRYDISTYVKYTSIIVCLAAAFYVGISHKRILIIITASLTLFADTFLLLINNYYIAGVTAFAVVQTLFGVYISPTYISFRLRVATYAVVLAFILPVSGFDPTALVSAWSYVNLVYNVIRLIPRVVSRSNKHFDKHLTMFTVGMTLFLACDTCVGLSNLGTYVPGLITGDVLSIVTYLMWVFYLPSQVLIVSSFSFNQEE